MAPAPASPWPRRWLARGLSLLRQWRPAGGAPISAQSSPGTAPPEAAEPDDVTTPLPLGTRGGYRLQRALVQGERGALHLATDPATGGPIALKTVPLLGSEASRERFLRESAVAARLQHPHIVRTFAAGIEGDGAQAAGWIAMEWISGGDLGRHTAPGRLLPATMVLHIGSTAAQALAHAHERGVVHRDLKPANLLFQAETATVKVADFGCARLGDAERSRSGLIAGTPAYMAPEQLSGLPVDGRCDLYALGAVLFELLTGRLPFPHASMGQLLTAIATEPAPALVAFRPDLPPALSELLAQLLAKSAIARPADGLQVAAALQSISEQMPPLDTAGVTSPPGQRA